MTFDPKCYDLASAFLEDHPNLFTEDACQQLAQHIQTAIDGWISDAAADANERAYDRHQEWLMETGGGPTLQEQQIAAMRFK
jgi:hypothetical protein